MIIAVLFFATLAFVGVASWFFNHEDRTIPRATKWIYLTIAIALAVAFVVVLGGKVMPIIFSPQ